MAGIFRREAEFGLMIPTVKLVLQCAVQSSEAW